MALLSPFIELPHDEDKCETLGIGGNLFAKKYSGICPLGGSKHFRGLPI